MDAVALGALGAGSAWALVSLAVVLIYRGGLVPRHIYDAMVHDRNEALTSSRIKDAQIAEKDVQLRHMSEVGRTVEAIMRSIQTNARESPREEDT